MSKQRVIVEAVLAGKSQREVARLYGISQPRVSQLIAAYRAGGWQALEPRSRRPRTNPNATPPAVIERVLALRTELIIDGADAGPHSIAAFLAREMDSPPGVTTIWRILTRAGVITPEPRKRPKRSWLRFEADLPNQCWQSDFTHWRLHNGHDAQILLWLDDHSRFLISATAHQTVTGGSVLDTFRAACTRHGMPQSTLTDNGMVFTTRHRGGANAFEIELANLGIEQKNGTPNHPQTQGKVERLNQTLKRWLAARPPAVTLTELHPARAVHRLLQHPQTPPRPEPRHPCPGLHRPAKATPDHNTGGHFRIRDDKVYANGTITVRRGGRMHHIGVGNEHAGKTVRMLIHDLDVIIIDRVTGEILRELRIDPNRDSQPRGTKPGPKKGTPRQGGMQKGYRYPKK
jgi:transposase InsO family protein